MKRLESGMAVAAIAFLTAGALNLVDHLLSGSSRRLALAPIFGAAGLVLAWGVRARRKAR
jgi:hypothetical protein